MVDYKIHLKNLAVTMSLGIHPDEKKTKQNMVMDVALTATPPHEFTIDQVVDYDQLAKDLVSICVARHFDLVEELADTVADHCLTLPPVKRAAITISKPEVAAILAGKATPIIKWVKKKD